MATKKETTPSSRRPSSSSSPEEDEKESAWSMFWLIGGALGIVAVCVLGRIFGGKIYREWFSSKVGLQCQKGESCGDGLKCEDTSFTPGAFYCKVKRGWPCSSKKDGDCEHEATCVEETEDLPKPGDKDPQRRQLAESMVKSGLPFRDKGTRYCKALPEASCRVNECVDSCVDHLEPLPGSMKICQVLKGLPCPSQKDLDCTEDAFCMQNSRQPDESDVEESKKSGLPVPEKDKFYCKGMPPAVRDDLRNAKCDWNLECASNLCDPVKKKCAVQKGGGCAFGLSAKPKDEACATGLTCLRRQPGWICEKTPSGANIQLGETTDTWHAANRSRVMKSNHLRKKRTSGFLQVDLD